MNKKQRIDLRVIPALLLVLYSCQAWSVELRVAVASNFISTMTVLAEYFENSNDVEVTLITGSTGKHYAQIINGAPFDVFFAADTKRPKLLEQQGVSIAGSRFTYATGKLILWSQDASRVDKAGKVLESGDFRYLAIANPRLAPYGRAAKEVLQKRGLWDKVRRKMVRGENINQAFQFVNSGNAEIGFVAYSQIVLRTGTATGSYWDIPLEHYSPINQQVVLLKSSPQARAFLSFIKSKQAMKIIKNHGYGFDSF